jgi:hypothetical protein
METFKTLNQKMITNCIRIIGNFIAVKEEICQYFIKQGLLDVLKKVFTYCSMHVRKDAFWLVSNIAANSEQDAI